MNYNPETEAEKAAPRAYPGPLSNKDILYDKDFYKLNDKDDFYNFPIKPELRDRFEYKVINKNQWNFLFEKYGGSPLPRKCYKSEYYSQYEPESKFEQWNLIILPPRDNFEIEKITTEKAIFLSKKLNLDEAKNRIIKILNQEEYGFNLSNEKVRFWKLDRYLNISNILKELEDQIDKIRTGVINNTNPDVDENLSIEFPGTFIAQQKNSNCIDKLSISIEDRIIIEQANSKGEFIFKFIKNATIGRCEFCYQDRLLIVSCRCKEVFYCSQSCLKRDEHFHEDKCSAADQDEDLSAYNQNECSNMGLTGLQNLGNTCFMNSGIQCLSNTVLLSRYFLENFYLPEINEVNPLGTKGKLARAFAKLVKILWYGSENVISPSALKRVVGKFHSNFMGFAQQDGQELITTILDGLHEDLNRVKNKPYVETKTSDDPNDNSMIASSWYDYLARNQSIVVDLMHGQYKSIVKCPKCNKYSITFDPFSMIPLPVPSLGERKIHLNYVPYDISKSIIKCVFVVKKTDTIDEVREKLSSLLNIPKYGSTFVLLSAKTFDQFLSGERKSKSITKAGNSTLHVQEINPIYFNGPENEGIETIKALRERQQKEKDDKDNKDEKMDISTDVQNSTLSGGYEEIKGVNNGMQSSVGAKQEKVEYNDDYNNGLSDDMLRVCLSIFSKMKYPYWSNYGKDRKTFNRLIHIKRSQTLKEMHMEIFRYFRPLFELELASNRRKANDNQMNNEENIQKGSDGIDGDNEVNEEIKNDASNDINNNPNLTEQKVSVSNNEDINANDSKDIPMEEIKDDKKMNDVDVDGIPKNEPQTIEEELKKIKNLTDDELFGLLFPDLTEENWREKLKIPNTYPYELRFVNISNKHGLNQNNCIYCGENCDNCIVPFVSDIKVKDMLAKFGTKINNDYFFTDHPYYCNRKEFELEVIFNDDKDNHKLDLELIEQVEVFKEDNAEKSSGTKVNIYNCFEQFSNWETLDENNVWYCPTCKDSVQASKRMEILRYPPILILHLKRFKIKEDKMTCRAGGRLSALIEFPLRNLDLTKYAQKGSVPPIYDLYAVSNHYGSTEYGHYTAFGLNREEWYKFDDSSVYKVDESQVCSTAAYVLFYKRKDIGNDIDYANLKQVIPEDYHVPIIESKPKVTPKGEEEKEDNKEILEKNMEDTKMNEKVNEEQNEGNDRMANSENKMEDDIENKKENPNEGSISEFNK